MSLLDSVSELASLVWSQSGRAYTASAQDKAVYLQAKAYFDALELPQVITGNPLQKVIVVNFDGTGNDKVGNPAEQTNVAILNDAANTGIKPIYEKGVGTERPAKIVQQALALGAYDRVTEALARLATTWADLKPTEGATPYLVVTGFSRGAAEARLFMNYIDQFGIPAKGRELAADFTTGTPDPQVPGGQVRMSALLYDTVKTGMSGDYGVPGTVDSLVHLTSRDERRVFFPLTSIEAGPGAFLCLAMGPR